MIYFIIGTETTALSKATLDDEYVYSNRRQDEADTKQQCLDDERREFCWDKSESSHIRGVGVRPVQESIVSAVDKY